MTDGIRSVRKRRTEVTVETRILTIIRSSASGLRTSVCGPCGCHVSTVPDMNACFILGTDLQTLNDLSNSGAIHRARNAGVCGHSLAQFCEQSGSRPPGAMTK